MLHPLLAGLGGGGRVNHHETGSQAPRVALERQFNLAIGYVNFESLGLVAISDILLPDVGSGQVFGVLITEEPVLQEFLVADALGEDFLAVGFKLPLVEGHVIPVARRIQHYLHDVLAVGHINGKLLAVVYPDKIASQAVGLLVGSPVQAVIADPAKALVGCIHGVWKYCRKTGIIRAVLGAEVELAESIDSYLLRALDQADIVQEERSAGGGDVHRDHFMCV